MSVFNSLLFVLTFIFIFVSCNSTDPLTEEFMNVVTVGGDDDDDDEEAEGAGGITDEQKKFLEDGKFSGELCGGAVKSR